MKAENINRIAGELTASIYCALAKNNHTEVFLASIYAPLKMLFVAEKLNMFTRSQIEDLINVMKVAANADINESCIEQYRKYLGANNEPTK